MHIVRISGGASFSAQTFQFLTQCLKLKSFQKTLTDKTTVISRSVLISLSDCYQKAETSNMSAVTQTGNNRLDIQFWLCVYLCFCTGLCSNRAVECFSFDTNSMNILV